MRIIAILTVYNEARFMDTCLKHLIAQGIDVYVVDNGSTDRTAEIARNYLGHGVMKIETEPRDGTFDIHRCMERKEELAASLDGDWFMHMDADELHVSPHKGQTLSEFIEDIDARGYNALNFLEFTFLPTREHPNHEHTDFAHTMKWYYPFLPRFPHRLNAWKKQAERVDLISSGGHLVQFPRLNMAPESAYMKHYLFLSVEHAIQKYVRMKFNQKALDAGWSRWRSQITPEMIQLPSENELRTYESDENLDPSNPRTQHYLAEIWAKKQPQ